MLVASVLHYGESIKKDSYSCDQGAYRSGLRGRCFRQHLLNACCVPGTIQSALPAQTLQTL